MQMPVEHKTLVFGQDLDNLSNAELISALKKAKTEREELAKINEGVSSALIASQIDGLNGAIDTIKGKLDSRSPTPAVTQAAE